MQGARDWYDDGVAEHYRAHGAAYRNPHAPIVAECVRDALGRWPIDTSVVLDLAAGAGELTLALRAVRPDASVVGCDPFTGEAYRAQTGQACEPHSFESVAAGALRGRRFSLVGCSFAMHLCARSLLPTLLLELTQVAPQLLILTPHKRPEIRDTWGWSSVGELVRHRVRARLYASTLSAASNIGDAPDTLRRP